MFVWWVLTTLTACSPTHNRRPSTHLWFPWQLIAAKGMLRFMAGDTYLPFSWNETLGGAIFRKTSSGSKTAAALRGCSVS